MTKSHRRKLIFPETVASGLDHIEGASHDAKRQPAYLRICPGADHKFVAKHLPAVDARDLFPQIFKLFATQTGSRWSAERRSCDLILAHVHRGALIPRYLLSAALGVSTGRLLGARALGMTLPEAISTPDGCFFFIAADVADFKSELLALADIAPDTLQDFSPLKPGRRKE